MYGKETGYTLQGHPNRAVVEWTQNTGLLLYMHMHDFVEMYAILLYV